MTDGEFLNDLERRARDKAKPFLATAEERARLGSIGERFFNAFEARTTTKRALVMHEIKQAKYRLVSNVREHVIA